MNSSGIGEEMSDEDGIDRRQLSSSQPLPSASACRVSSRRALMLDCKTECAAPSGKGSEPVVLCSKMLRIAAAFLKETDPEGYEMLCEGLAQANPDSIAFIHEHLLKGRTDDAEQAEWDLPSLIIGHRLAVAAGRCALIEPGSEECPRGWRIRVKKGGREKVTMVWDRFSASDMRHDIKLPSVARLSEKERALLSSSAEPATVRLELEPEPHLVLSVNGALAEDLGLPHWSPSLGIISIVNGTVKTVRVDTEIEEIDGELHYELSNEALMQIMAFDDDWLTTSVVPGAWYCRVPSVDGTRVPVAWSMMAHNTVEVPMPASVYAALNRRIPWFGVDDAERWITRMLREGQSLPC